MASLPSKNIWIRRQQCPCGDWKCYVTHEGDIEDTSSAATSSQFRKNEASTSDSMVAPYVGMVFKTDDEAFEYYGAFARRNGFSIRKERSRLSPQLGVYKRDFVCYRSGFAPAKKKLSTGAGAGAGEHHRDRKSARCGCDSKMYLSKEIVQEGVSQWFVVQFSNVHNHELLEDDQVRLLPAYRKIQESDQERILLLSKAGFPIHRIVKVLELEKGIHDGQLPFLERDVRNFVQNRKKLIQESDALLAEKRENDVLELLEACKAAMEKKGFVYDLTVDENGRAENVAWSYRDSVQKYAAFGDVVYFDTSYRSVTYSLLFGAWFGIDANGRTIFFGCVLLRDETARSFSWALQTFINFMGGSCPQTILTDLYPGLKEAIRADLPGTNHVICLGDVLSKLWGWFYHPLGSRYTEFKSNFNALCRLESAEEFEIQWNQMVSAFGLGTDKHIELLCLFRVSWAPCYTRGNMLAHMATDVYLKSINVFLNGFFNAQPCLRSFFEQVGITVNVQNEARSEIQYGHPKTCIPIEDQARRILTPFAFNAFQHELALAMQYATSEMASDGSSHLVSHFRKMDAERLVIWIPDEERIHCYCKEFESSGTLCRHALRVFVAKNYFELPEKYYLDRWRRESPLGAYEDREEWFREFRGLTESLFAESSVTKERSYYSRSELMRELSRILAEVRNMPESEVGAAMDVTLSPDL